MKEIQHFYIYPLFWVVIAIFIIAANLLFIPWTGFSVVTIFGQFIIACVMFIQYRLGRTLYMRQLPHVFIVSFMIVAFFSCITQLVLL